MMSDYEDQIQRRMPLLDVLTKFYSDVDDTVVIGFGIIIEYITADGERGIHKLTSDASGKPLPEYIVEGISSALEYLAEFDEIVQEDE
jgi:hypothetical protein